CALPISTEPAAVLLPEHGSVVGIADDHVEAALAHDRLNCLLPRGELLGGDDRLLHRSRVLFLRGWIVPNHNQEQDRNKTFHFACGTLLGADEGMGYRPTATARGGPGGGQRRASVHSLAWEATNCQRFSRRLELSCSRPPPPRHHRSVPARSARTQRPTPPSGSTASDSWRRSPTIRPSTSSRRRSSPR